MATPGPVRQLPRSTAHGAAGASSRNGMAADRKLAHLLLLYTTFGIPRQPCCRHWPEKKAEDS